MSGLTEVECPSCGERGLAVMPGIQVRETLKRDEQPGTDYEYYCHIGTLKDRLPGYKVVHR